MITVAIRTTARYLDFANRRLRINLRKRITLIKSRRVAVNDG
jgi:hypothetical protein